RLDSENVRVVLEDALLAVARRNARARVALGIAKTLRGSAVLPRKTPVVFGVNEMLFGRVHERGPADVLLCLRSARADPLVRARVRIEFAFVKLRVLFQLSGCCLVAGDAQVGLHRRRRRLWMRSAADENERSDERDLHCGAF